MWPAGRLDAILAEVQAAKVLVLFLTPGCLLRPWVLLECFWATVHKVVCVDRTAHAQLAAARCRAPTAVG